MFLALALSGLIFEVVADLQLTRFRAHMPPAQSSTLAYGNSADTQITSASGFFGLAFALSHALTVSGGPFGNGPALRFCSPA